MKITLLIYLLVISNIYMYAQEFELDELSTPATPAFSLLGLSPTNINRPTHSKPFLMSLANGLNGTGIAANIAIETTPYWWSSHPGLTYSAFYGLDSDTNAKSPLIQQIQQSFAFSLATSDATLPNDSIESRLIAAGFRFQVLKGQPSSAFKSSYLGIVQNALVRDVIDEIKEQIADEEEKNDPININTLIQEKTEELVEVTDYPNESKKETSRNQAIAYLKERLKPLSNTTDRKKAIEFLEKERQLLTDLVNQDLIQMQSISRVGWLLEFAGAASLLAPTNNITYTLGQEWAAWGTLTYRFDAPPGSDKVNDFNLLMRYGGNFTVNSSFNTDIGTSWSLAGENFSLALEAIFRSYRTYQEITATDGKVYQVSERNNTWRLAVAYQYRVADMITIALTVGKDFENSYLTTGGMFTLLNFNFAMPSKESFKVE